MTQPIARTMPYLYSPLILVRQSITPFSQTVSTNETAAVSCGHFRSDNWDYGLFHGGKGRQWRRYWRWRRLCYRRTHRRRRWCCCRCCHRRGDIEASLIHAPLRVATSLCQRRDAEPLSSTQACSHSRRILDTRATLTLCHGRIAGGTYVPLS